MARLKIGEMMMRAGLLDQLQLNAALAHQRQWGGKLGSVMVELGFVDEEMLWKGLAAQLGFPRIDLANAAISAQLIQRVPVDMCEKYMLFPVSYRDDTKTLTVATSDPNNTDALDDLQFRTRWKVACGLAPDTEVQWAIRHYYKNDSSPCPPLRKRKALAVDSGDEELKITDMAGNTVMKRVSDIQPPGGQPMPQPPNSNPFGNPGSVAAFGTPTSVAGAPPGALSPELAALKAELDRNNRFIKTLVELCITRGIFTQEEYVERMKR